MSPELLGILKFWNVVQLLIESVGLPKSHPTVTNRERVEERDFLEESLVHLSLLEGRLEDDPPEGGPVHRPQGAASGHSLQIRIHKLKRDASSHIPQSSFKVTLNEI